MSEQDLEELEEVEEWLSLQAYLSFLEQQEEAELSWCVCAPGQIARPGSATYRTIQAPVSVHARTLCGLPGCHTQRQSVSCATSKFRGGVAYNVFVSCPHAEVCALVSCCGGRPRRCESEP